MATTSHLALTLVESAQAQKEVTVNEALARIDALLNTGAKDKDLATPPGSPASGDVYIIAASPTGDWSGKAGQIAFFDQIWRFIVPREGMTLWVNDEDIAYSYTGSAWVSLLSQKTDCLMVAVGDETTTITTGTTKLTFRMPYALTLTHVRASLSMPWLIWTEEDQAIFAGIISFYFGSRALKKFSTSK